MFVFSNFLDALATLLGLILELALWLIIIRALISWVSPDPYNPIVRFLVSATEPILRPIQQMLPPMGGLDLSPIVAIFIIIFLKSFLVRTLHDIAMRIA
ncbi:MAG: YggT family protein [Nitrospinota bacterium]|nr:YggT family protein [Nitrospinota bacterium]